ncbi:MAG: ATP-dependent Clp protease ATP-binding subunit [Sandaracinaceae bacterium]|nr:ATP-dependent Clp protease ATP-binding subunit [Sandaracinaceae bacterium]
MSERSLRVHLVALDDGRLLGTLMRTRESFFDAYPPAAYAESEEIVLEQLGTALRRLLVTREDEIDRYLWQEDFQVRTVSLGVHPSTMIRKETVVGKREVPLKLGYAWSETESGAFRVMLPRFRWWLVLEDLESASKVLEHVVSASLAGEEARWLYELRKQGEERVLAWRPEWLARHTREPVLEAAVGPPMPTVEGVCDEWVERAARKKLPRPIGDDPLFEGEAPRFRQRVRPSVVLVGERGVGKTTFVRRLARRLWQSRKEEGAPKRLWATSADRILAGMLYLGMWQERCLAMVDELSGEGDSLSVDRLLEILQPQSDGASIADVLGPAVIAGEIPLLCECTEAELVEARRRFASLVESMHVVRIAEPRASDMLPLLRTCAAQEGLDVHPRGLSRLLRHLDHFERQTRFPGKAFATVARLAREAGGKRLDPADVSAAYARMSGLPIEIVADERSATTSEMAERLRAGVVGQDPACERAAQVLSRLKSGLKDPERPIGTLLFVGPTGVGKTELAKQLARVLFGDASRMVRVDLSEYMLPGSMERMLHVGRGVTSLAEQVHRRPLSLVLFDELEKAHPEVFDLMLGILGEGRLTDAMGRLVDFRMTLVVMTSNLGVSESSAVGFDARPAQSYERAVRDFFRPELVNRIDHVVSFRALAPADVRRIVDLELAKAITRPGLRRRGLSLLVDPGARDRLAELGFHPTRGARPLRRVIEERVFTPLAARIAADPSLRDRRIPIVARESDAEARLNADEVAVAIRV